MSYIAIKNGNKDVNLFYQDIGEGQPVVLIHGWPLNHQMWEYQLSELPKHGLRCIAYDRRGFGASDKPWDGYDYDTMADDLKTLLNELNLQNVVLVGFSMGGGEVVRYMSKYNGDRVSKIVLMSSIAPYMLKTDNNPDGVPKNAFDGFIEDIKKDRPAFMQEFTKGFYGVDQDMDVSDGILDWSFIMAMQASQKATTDCITAFGETDLRQDIRRINVPALVIHGKKDKTVPIAATGDQAANMLPNAEYIVYDSAPHATFYNEKDKVNKALIQFIKIETADMV